MELVRDSVQQHSDEQYWDEDIQDYIMRVVNDDTYGDVEKLYNGIEQVINITTDRNCKPVIRNMGDHKYGSIDERKIHGLVSLRSIIRKILLTSFGINLDVRQTIEQVYDMVWSVIKDHGTKEFQVFTTNYDQVIETYAEETDLDIINGFEPYRRLSRIWTNMWDSGTDRPPLYLAKMHGSIHWYKDDDYRIVETGSIADRDADRDIMIAPTEGAKDYNEEPFSALIDRFRATLREVDVLLVIGFSYRDDEIVNIIKERLKNGMALISVSPDAATSIGSMADTTIRTINTDVGHIKISGSQIVLCEEEFGPNTIGDLCATLNEAFRFIRANRT